LKAVLETPTVRDSTMVVMGLRSVFSLGLTLVVVGLFLTLGHYFRSERVQSMFITLDGPEPEPDDE
jgi:hypothetical protein